MPVKVIWFKEGMLMVALNNIIGALNYQDDVLLKKYEYLRHQGARSPELFWPTFLWPDFNEQKLHFFPDHNPSNCNVEFKESSGAHRQEIRQYHVFHVVLYAHINKARKIAFFKLSKIFRPALHCLSKRCYASPNCGRNVCSVDYLYRMC